MATQSWNPLRCEGTELDPNVLLMAKLVALCLLLTRHVTQLPDPFLPFIPGLDALLPAEVFRRGLQVIFVVSAVALLFNRWVRWSALVLGCTILFAVVSSKEYYGNNKTLCGCLLVLAALSTAGRKPWLLRWQMAIVYFGAGLNKLLDPDWQTGVFFDHWAGERLAQPIYLWAAPLFPPLVLAKLACWATIAGEISAAVCFLTPRFYHNGIYVSVMFQSTLLLFTGTTFTMFFYAMQAAMLVFVDWPRSPLTVIYDGDCGFCELMKRQFSRMDFEGRFAWRPFQTGAGHALGITDQAANERLHLSAAGVVDNGFRAVRRMLLYNPFTYFVMAVVIAVPPNGWSTWRRLAVAGFLAFFLPVSIPIGSAAYDWVARHRHQIYPKGECKIA
jgi:predicted DCC family thiol-disulfide oxidoreductase YuxK